MPTTSNLPALLDTRSAAAALGLSVRTLEGFRSRGGGPPFVKVGAGPRSAVRYRADDLAAYLDRQRRSSTADYAPAV